MPPASLRSASSDFACATVRGYPSKIAPPAASFSASRSFSIFVTRSSGTSAPDSMIGFAIAPSGVPLATWLLRRSPVDTWGMPSDAARRDAWVPLPDPGGPKNTMADGMAA